MATRRLGRDVREVPAVAELREVGGIVLLDELADTFGEDTW